MQAKSTSSGAGHGLTALAPCAIPPAISRGWRKRGELIPRLRKRREQDYLLRSLPRDINDSAEQRAAADWREWELHNMRARGGRWASPHTLERRAAYMQKRECTQRRGIESEESRLRSSAARLMQRHHEMHTSNLVSQGLKGYDVQWSEAAWRSQIAQKEQKARRSILERRHGEKRGAAAATEQAAKSRRAKEEDLYIDTVTALHRVLQEESNVYDGADGVRAPVSFWRARRKAAPLRAACNSVLRFWLESRDALGMPPLPVRHERTPEPLPPTSPKHTSEFRLTDGFESQPNVAVTSPNLAATAPGWRRLRPAVARKPLLSAVMADFASASNVPWHLRPLLSPRSAGKPSPERPQAQLLDRPTRRQGDRGPVRRARSAAARCISKDQSPLEFLSGLVRESHAADSARLGGVRARTASARPCSPSPTKPTSRPPSAVRPPGGRQV